MPTVFNNTELEADLVPLIDAEGRNVAVVIAKATYEFTPEGGMQWAETQQPLTMVDEFMGEPGASPLRVPSDVVDWKAAADVIIVPPPMPLKESPLRDRKISLELSTVRASQRVGRAWPFGPVGRDESPRAGYAGTYDEDWVANRMPLLPTDFDSRFHQAAPPNQTVQEYLRGDETLKVSGLYDNELSEIETSLPGRTMAVGGNVLGSYFTKIAHLDTVLIWSTPPQLTLTWRCVLRPRQKIEEVGFVHIYYWRLRAAERVYGAL